MKVYSRLFPLLFIAVLFTGCASSPRLSASDDALSLSQVLELRRQVSSDAALIEQIDRRPMAFALTPDDTRQLRENGVSEVLIAYLQGRTAGQRDVAAAAPYYDTRRGAAAIRPYYGSSYYGSSYYGSSYYGSSYYGSPYYGSPSYAPHGYYYGGHGNGHGFSHHRGHH